jgi:hypothetical protein
MSEEFPKGIPGYICVVNEKGLWYSRAQVRLHIPSPTGDSSDWIELDVPCRTTEQAIAIAQNYQQAFGCELRIPVDRVY